ncbi:transglycosylase SLT domain-containing protein [Nocardia sp. NPDC051030]|uniref:transglycosylase SLT domain-containing protein n=1 Tax=Nocardia sp. NPDC051030 TaxID=3155162 RepID=UPI0034313A08
MSPKPSPLPVPHLHLRTPSAARTAGSLALAVVAVAAIATAAGRNDDPTAALEAAGGAPMPTTTELQYQPGLMVPPPPAVPTTTEAPPAAELVANPAEPALELKLAHDSVPPPPVYPAGLDGWILESLDIMAANGIPGSYDGIHRNVLRESGGNPEAINLWDSNAALGIPSKGLLQVIDPTFNAYHVPGTPFDVWDPVANIVAACNYAAARYGSIDHVDGPY